MGVAVCCGVLQCATACCSVLQRVAVCYSVLQCNKRIEVIPKKQQVESSVLQCAGMCCRVLEVVAVCCSVLQCVALCCSDTEKAPGREQLLPNTDAASSLLLQCIAV